jgi:hypothetical protein
MFSELLIQHLAIIASHFRGEVPLRQNTHLAFWLNCDGSEF